LIINQCIGFGYFSNPVQPTSELTQDNTHLTT
jgi:hypothetical protein